MLSLRKILLLLAIITGFVGTPETVSAQVFSSTQVENARARLSVVAPGLVKIWVSCEGKTYEGAGVVFTDRGNILTAAHVGNACIGKTQEVWVGAVSSLYGVPDKTHRADITERVAEGVTNPTAAQSAFTRKQDIALYKLRAGQTLIAPARFANDPPVAGDAIHVVGFADLPFIGANAAMSAGVSVFRTTLVSVAADAKDVPLRLHYGGGSWKGMSGGPVYNSNNELVGIHSARATLDVTNLLNEKCDPRLGNCFNNSLAFDYRDASGAVKRQVVNVDFEAVKSILENYSWATSIHAIPASWLKP